MNHFLICFIFYLKFVCHVSTQHLRLLLDVLGRADDFGAGGTELLAALEIDQPSSPVASTSSVGVPNHGTMEWQDIILGHREWSIWSGDKYPVFRTGTPNEPTWWTRTTAGVLISGTRLAHVARDVVLGKHKVAASHDLL